MSLDADLWEGLIPLTRSVRFTKGDVFLRGGEMAHTFGWVGTGIMRKYYVGANGREHNSAFSVDGSPFGSFADLTSGLPSKVYIDCLEDTDAVVMEWDDFRALCVRDPRWAAVSAEMSVLLFARKNQREQSLLTLSAEERYKHLLEHAPEIALRVPLYHLASHLGMTPEHLSRVRAKISHGSRRPPSK
jgi:CRP-like cAMP-binding protein